MSSQRTKTPLIKEKNCAPQFSLLACAWYMKHEVPSQLTGRTFQGLTDWLNDQRGLRNPCPVLSERSKYFFIAHSVRVANYSLSPSSLPETWIESAATIRPPGSQNYIVSLFVMNLLDLSLGKMFLSNDMTWKILGRPREVTGMGEVFGHH